MPPCAALLCTPTQPATAHPDPTLLPAHPDPDHGCHTHEPTSRLYPCPPCGREHSRQHYPDTPLPQAATRARPAARRLPRPGQGTGVGSINYFFIEVATAGSTKGLSASVGRRVTRSCSAHSRRPGPTATATRRSTNSTRRGSACAARQRSARTPLQGQGTNHNHGPPPGRSGRAVPTPQAALHQVLVLEREARFSAGSAPNGGPRPALGQGAQHWHPTTIKNYL